MSKNSRVPSPAKLLKFSGLVWFASAVLVAVVRWGDPRVYSAAGCLFMGVVFYVAGVIYGDARKEGVK